MQIAWMTDIHLNFVDLPEIERLTTQVREMAPDAVLIGGDIGEADNLRLYLELLTEKVPSPIYFVLGNHDFYRGSIAEVRAEAETLTQQFERLTWLPAAGVVPLTPTTALIGHGGWGDGGYGNAAGTPVMLNDFLLIAELRDRSGDLLSMLRRLGKEAADHFRRVLPQAFENHRHVVVLTHVPPFREASWHEGQESDEDWLPFFACRAVGDELRSQMQQHPAHQMTVLCGHTHGSGECQILPNLKVLTGGAEYGKPQVQRLLAIQ